MSRPVATAHFSHHDVIWAVEQRRVPQTGSSRLCSPVLPPRSEHKTPSIALSKEPPEISGVMGLHLGALQYSSRTISRSGAPPAPRA